MKYIIISIIILQSFFATAQPDRKNAPEATAPQALELGEFSEIKLDNGMEIFLVKRPGYPKFTMSMSIDQPDINKDPQQEKRNILSAAYSKRACKEYTEEEVKKMTTYLGAQMGASFNGGFIKGMKRDANTLLEVFSKQLLYPLITQEDIDEKAKAYNKNQKNKASKPIKSELRNFSNHLTDSLVYGSMQTAKKKQQELDYSDVTIANIWEYHKERLSGANTTIVLVGNFSEKEVKSLFNKYFSAFPKGEKLVKDVDVIDGKSILTDRQIYVIDNPLANQSKISFHWGIDGAFPYSNEEYKMQVMNEILGGSQLAYLYTNIREEKGLCYFIGANIGSSNAGGSAFINTKVRTEEVNVAVENIILEMMRIRNKNVSHYDLKIAKNIIKIELKIKLN